MYSIGDILETDKGILFVQCSLPFQGELLGKTLHWVQTESGQDELYWDKELSALNPKLISDEEFHKYLPV